MVQTIFQENKPMHFTHPPYFSSLLPISPYLTYSCILDRVRVLDGKSRPSVYWTNSLTDTSKTKMSTLTYPLISNFPILNPWSPETRIHWYSLSQNSNKDFSGIRELTLYCICNAITYRSLLLAKYIMKYRGQWIFICIPIMLYLCASLGI